MEIFIPDSADEERLTAVDSKTGNRLWDINASI